MQNPVGAARVTGWRSPYAETQASRNNNQAILKHPARARESLFGAAAVFALGPSLERMERAGRRRTPAFDQWQHRIVK